MWPAVLILGHVPIGNETYRYGLLIVPSLLLLAAHALSKIRLAPLLTVVALASVTFTVAADTSNFAAAPSCYQPLVETSRSLEAQHRTAVWASYWVSGPLEMCSGERVAVSSVVPLRDHFAEVRAAAAPQSTYVVFPGRELDQELRTSTRAPRAGDANDAVVLRGVGVRHDRVAEPDWTAQQLLTGRRPGGVPAVSDRARARALPRPPDRR